MKNLVNYSPRYWLLRAQRPLGENRFLYCRLVFAAIEKTGGCVASGIDLQELAKTVKILGGLKAVGLEELHFRNAAIAELAWRAAGGESLAVLKYPENKPGEKLTRPGRRGTYSWRRNTLTQH